MCSGFPNGTNGIPISFKILPMVPMVIGNANGTIDSPNGTIGANGKPMVPLVSQWYLPMVPLGEPRTESSIMCPIKGRQSIAMINGHFNPLYKKKYRSRFLLYSAICLGFCDGLHDNKTGKLKFPK